MISKRILCLFLSVIIIFSTSAVFSENEKTQLFLYSYGKEKNENTKIKVSNVNGENIFIMPSSVKPCSVKIFYEGKETISLKGKLKEERFISGKAINLNEFCEGTDYILSFIKNGKKYDIRFIFSENVPSLYLVSENPEEKGRQWVEERADKSNKAKGFIVMQSEDGEILYDGELTQIKGRGNSTWSQKKKPYQIKTAEKTDLLNSGKDENMSKTWVLLANYLDSSLLNNFYALKIGKALGMNINIESIHTDLYYDGEYRGSYLLSEKVEVGKGRVNIENLEVKNAEANEGEVIEEMPVKKGETKNGAIFTYCEGMKSPEDITGGYLLEMDYEERALEEISYFKTSRGQYVVVKSPEFASKEEMEYIASFYQDYEDAVFNGGINPRTGRKYSDYVDSQSVAAYYLINELSKARDFFSSSAYLHKEAGSNKMYMGPLWDYDLSFGKSRYEENENEPSRGISIYNTKLGEQLLKTEDFPIILENMYINKLYPLIKDILLGDKEKETTDGEIHSVLYEKERIGASFECNSLLWHNGVSFESEISNLTLFLKERAEFLKEYTFSFADVYDYKSHFRDVLKKDWFYEDINSILRLGYMYGVKEGYFDPYAKLRRSEAVQTLFNMSRQEKPEYEEVYSDVKKEDWFSSAVVWAYKEGITDEDEMFSPSFYVSREDLVTYLYRYENEPFCEGVIPDTFADRNEVSPYAQNAVLWAIQNGILKGDPYNRINPRATITRAELAVVLSRYSAR